MHLIILLVFLSVLASSAHAAEVYRWTDDAGRVHYGDKVPDAQKAKAKPVDVKAVQVPEAERAAAQARLAREKSTVEAMRRNRQESTLANVTTLPAVKTAAAPPAKLTCAQEWERFNQSGACFAPFHTKFGIKAEAANHCTSVLMPTCPNPYHPSSERR